MTIASAILGCFINISSISCWQSVPCGVDHIIFPWHNVEVAIFVLEAWVAGIVVSWHGAKIFFDIFVVVVENGVHEGRRKGLFDIDRSYFVWIWLNLYKVVFVGSQGLWVKQIASLMDYFGHFGLLAQLQCVINQLFVVNYPGRLFSGVGTNDQFRLTIFDTVGQFIRWETAEYDDMSCAYPCASVDGDETFDCHGHVYDNSISCYQFEFMFQGAR